VCQWAPDIKGEPLKVWKEFALKSTNAVYQKVPEPDFSFGPSVWMRLIKKSHSGLLAPGAIERIAAWQSSSTERQRSALSELLWSFKDHLIALKGKTEQKQKFLWPGGGEVAHINLIDPFASNMGRPSSAPIVHAIQLKFEAKKRAQEAAQVELAERLKAEQKAREGMRQPEKPKKDTFASQIPFNMGSSSKNLESTAQAQMKTVKPADLAKAIEWARPFEASCPPATSGMGRHLGKPQLHGDVQYERFWPIAGTTFQPLDQMRRPHNVPGYDRLQKFTT